MALQAADHFISTFWDAVNGGLFTNAVLDQMLITGVGGELLSPARSVAMARDKLLQHLGQVKSLPLGWRHFGESESQNPHPVWGCIRRLENATASAEAFRDRMQDESLAEDKLRQSKRGQSRRRRGHARQQEGLVGVVTLSVAQPMYDALAAKLAQAQVDIQQLHVHIQHLRDQSKRDEQNASFDVDHIKSQNQRDLIVAEGAAFEDGYLQGLAVHPPPPPLPPPPPVGGYFSVPPRTV